MADHFSKFYAAIEEVAQSCMIKRENCNKCLQAVLAWLKNKDNAVIG